jgi:FkbM family methyltransferase
MYDDSLKPYHEQAIRKQCNVITLMFKEPEVIYDIGPAKIGTEAWILRERWKNCDIIGFEPCEYRYNNLIKSYPGYLFKHAISDKNNFIEGYMGSGKSEHGNDFVLTHEENELKYYKPCKVLSRTLDSINKEYGYEDIVIWADVEGAELSVLKGSTNILEKGYVKGLNLELFDISNVEGWCTKDEVVKFLVKYSYYCIQKSRSYDNHGDYIFKKG